MVYIKKILINTIGGGAAWTGGLYYARNIAFELTQNEYIRENYQIYVCCTKRNLPVFADLKDRIKLTVCPFKGMLPEYLYMEFICFTRRIRYLYWGYRKPLTPWTKLITWIADFQHNHFPDYFSEKDIQERNDAFRKAAESDIPVVLSSEDSLHDFRTYYPSTKKNIYVVPFVSYIEPMIRQTNGKEKEILQRLNLDGKRYACVMNQFWQHKNHKVVFEALKTLYEQQPEMDLDIVMTGEMSDYRNPDYIETLKRAAENPAVKNHLHLLGFISRTDQIAVMKNAEFVIQPSLFEGWGTVAEDAKILDKTILLSDIPVHREQKNDKCILFDPGNAEALAGLIRLENEKEHHDNPEAGIRDMYRRAVSYSKGFEQLLRESEKGHADE